MEEAQLIEYFDNSEMNQKLLKLYESKWDIVLKIHKLYEKNKVLNPDTNEKLNLVFYSSCIPYNYEKMKYKILMVGQETNGWIFEKSAKESILYTLGFLNSHEHDGALSFTFPYKFCKSINNLEVTEDSIKTYFTRISLRKFVYDKKHALCLNKEIQNIIDNEFNILEEEIKIIAPDIVLFLTGPNYDCHIRKQLNDIEFKEVENYNIRQFARVEHKSLPKNSFRIYRPEYLNRVHKKDEYLERLKKECGL